MKPLPTEPDKPILGKFRDGRADFIHRRRGKTGWYNNLNKRVSHDDPVAWWEITNPTEAEVDPEILVIQKEEGLDELLNLEKTGGQQSES